MKSRETKELRSRLERLGVFEEDLIEKFILGTGSGGQKINKTASCVYLCHIPTGIEVKCQKERSREANRFLARLELCKKLQARKQKEEQEKKAKKAKEIRQKRAPSKAQKAKNIEAKRLKSLKKTLRRPPKNDN